MKDNENWNTTIEKTLSTLTVQLVCGDISDQPDMDAIVNAANAQLRIGGGVAGAIHRKGDPELERETRPLAPISPGEAVISGAPNLPNRHVIHCLGPVYKRDNPSDKLLASCYRNALRLADKYELSSVAFPAISTGAFGYPTGEAAVIALRTINTEASGLKFVRLVRIVLWSEEDNRIFQNALESMDEPPG